MGVGHRVLVPVRDLLLSGDQQVLFFFFLESSAPVGPSIMVPADLIKITVQRMFATNNGFSLVTGVRLVRTGKPIVNPLFMVNQVCKDAHHPLLLWMAPAA